MARIGDALGWLLFLAVLLGLLTLFLLGPVALAWETGDILSMRRQAVATVVAVDVAASRKGGRPVVRYDYRVDGVDYESERYMPGFLANRGRWTGGGEAAKRFAPGQRVVIHHSSSDPRRACLEYGWFKWSVGWTLATWGIVVVRTKAHILGSAMLVAGAACIILAPNALRVGDAPWYLLAFAGIYVACSLYHRWGAVSAKPTRSTEIGLQGEGDGPPRKAADFRNRR